MQKIHMGCGTVYLEGWINCDIKGPKTFYAFERPDLVAQYITTEDKYYARHEATDISRFKTGPKDVQSVFDVDASFQKLPFPDNFADEILSRQVFEHQSITEAEEALGECIRVLKPEGYLRIDVPDLHETLNKLAETGDLFYSRHFFGPIAKGSRGYHCMGYTRESLRELVEDGLYDLGNRDFRRFRFVDEEPNIHIYPAFCLKFKKV